MSVDYVTYFDRNYLAKGLTLYESLQKSDPESKLIIVTMDEYSRVILERLNLKNVSVVPLHEIEKNDSELLIARQTRKTVEYLWTLTPTIILSVFDKYSKADYLAYVDADLYFYTDIKPLLQEMGSKSVLIHKHNFPQRLQHLERFGVYNVGLIICKRDRESFTVLNDWREKCNEWCHDYDENGKFGDQGYLTSWPQRFSSVHVTTNIGAGVAPWNQEQFQYTTDQSGKVAANGVPIVFYHFHSYKFLNVEAIIPSIHVDYGTSLEVIKTFAVPYAEKLKKSIALIQSVVNDFSCGLLDQQFELTERHSFIASGSIIEELKNIELPHTKVPLSDGWIAYMGT